MKRIICFLAVALVASVVVSCSKDKSGSRTKYGVDGKTPLPAAIDLGILVNGKPLKWASCNLGASKPYDYGDYYAWGETDTYYKSLEPLSWKERGNNVLHYDWASYKYANGAIDKIIKYCPSGATGSWDYTVKPSGPDGDLKLLPSDDVAHVRLGGKWRMPTEDDINSLMTLKANSDYKWEEWVLLLDEKGNERQDAQGNAIRGLRITRKSTGATLFIPAAGNAEGESVGKGAGAKGLYWSASLSSSANNAKSLQFGSSLSPILAASTRLYGLSVRPVCD